MAVFIDPNHPPVQMKTETIHHRKVPVQSPDALEEQLVSLRKQMGEHQEQIAKNDSTISALGFENQRLQGSIKILSQRISALAQEAVSKPVNTTPFRFYE